MTYQENRNKGGRPKAVKGKARTKTISTRLTLAEWKAVMRRITDAGKKPSHFLRELLLYGKVVAARTQEDRQQIRMPLVIHLFYEVLSLLCMMQI